MDGMTSMRWLSRLAAAALSAAGVASAADVHVMISAGFYRVYSELGPAFERASGRFYDRLAWAIGGFLIAMVVLSIWLIRRDAAPGTLLYASLIALLLASSSRASRAACNDSFTRL